MEVKPLKRSQTLLNIFFGFLCLFVFFVERRTGKPESQHMRQKAKASHFLQRPSSKFSTFLILFKSRLQILLFKEVESVETCRGRLSQMEANCEKKEDILKETLLKQRTDSLSEQRHKRTARYKISRMLRASANAFCPRTL